MKRPFGKRPASTVMVGMAGNRQDLHLLATTDRNGNRRDITYDALDRGAGETWTVSGSTTNVLTYGYDAADNLTGAADYHGAYTFTLDVLNRRAGQQGPFGGVLTYGYDAAGNTTEVDDSFGGTLTSAYDALERLTRRGFGGTGQTPLHVELTWTSQDLLSLLKRYSDAGGSTLVGTASYGYDGAGRLTDLWHKDGGGTALASYAYSYDNADRLTHQTIDGVGTSYAYDSADQLTQDGASTYGYDAAGNRTNTGYATGTGNEMTNDGTWTYTYDNQGQTTKKSKGASAETWTFGYDLRGELAWAKDSATDGGTVLSLSTYVYDVFGNRIETDVWTQSSGTTPVSRFLFDGRNIWAQLDGSNALTMRRLYLDGVNQPFARIDSGGTAAWYGQDSNGSVRLVISADGTTVLDRTVFDGTGNITSESNAAAGDWLKFQGGMYDYNTGFTHFGDREFDAATDRWLQRDPTGFDGGDANLYRGMGNEPTNGTDPSGTIFLVLRNQKDSWLAILKRKYGIDAQAFDLGLGMSYIHVGPEEFSKIDAISEANPFDGVMKSALTKWGDWILGKISDDGGMLSIDQAPWWVMRQMGPQVASIQQPKGYAFFDTRTTRGDTWGSYRVDVKVSDVNAKKFYERLESIPDGTISRLVLSGHGGAGFGTVSIDFTSGGKYDKVALLRRKLTRDATIEIWACQAVDNRQRRYRAQKLANLLGRTVYGWDGGGCPTPTHFGRPDAEDGNWRQFEPMPTGATLPPTEPEGRYDEVDLLAPDWGRLVSSDKCGRPLPD